MMKKTIVLRKTASLVLALLMIVSTLVVLPFSTAAEEVGTGKGWADSDATNKIYYIASAADMQSFQADTTAQSAGAKVYLTDDIDMSQVIDWAPVATFYGEFDGQGHTIKGISVPNGGNNAGALFKLTYDGVVIKNVTLDRCEVVGSGWSGIVVGSAFNGGVSMSNVHVKNSSISTGSGNYAGGLFGRITQAGTGGKYEISNCSVVNSSISANKAAGSLIGGVADKADLTVEISNCYSDATVSGTAYVGGLVGWNVIKTGSSLIMSNCVYAGQVTHTGDKAGAIVGTNALVLNMSDCAFVGSVGGSQSAISMVGEDTGTVTETRCVAAENFETQKESLVAAGWVETDGVVTVGDKKINILVPNETLANYFKCPIPTTNTYYQKQDNGDGTVDIRFVAVINDLDYANVGFDVQITRDNASIDAQTSAVISKSTTTVYKSVTALGEAVTAEALRTTGYLYVIEIQNVDVKNYEHTFSINAFATMQNGIVLQLDTAQTLVIEQEPAV